MADFLKQLDRDVSVIKEISEKFVVPGIADFDDEAVTLLYKIDGDLSVIKRKFESVSQLYNLMLVAQQKKKDQDNLVLLYARIKNGENMIITDDEMGKIWGLREDDVELFCKETNASKTATSHRLKSGFDRRYDDVGEISSDDEDWEMDEDFMAKMSDKLLATSANDVWEGENMEVEGDHDGLFAKVKVNLAVWFVSSKFPPQIFTCSCEDWPKTQSIKIETKEEMDYQQLKKYLLERLDLTREEIRVFQEGTLLRTWYKVKHDY